MFCALKFVLVRFFPFFTFTVQNRHLNERYIFLPFSYRSSATSCRVLYRPKRHSEGFFWLGAHPLVPSALPGCLPAALGCPCACALWCPGSFSYLLQKYSRGAIATESWKATDVACAAICMSLRKGRKEWFQAKRALALLSFLSRHDTWDWGWAQKCPFRLF